MGAKVSYAAAPPPPPSPPPSSALLPPPGPGKEVLLEKPAAAAAADKTDWLNLPTPVKYEEIQREALSKWTTTSTNLPSPICAFACLLACTARGPDHGWVEWPAFLSV